MLNVSAKCLHFRFEFVEGQNTKIHAKYQNSFQAQNGKISAVSTPILMIKASFFSIFQALPETPAKILFSATIGFLGDYAVIASPRLQNFRNRRKPLHQILEIQRKCRKQCNILILWLYLVL